MSNKPDYQKREAVRSKWDLDGERAKKSTRNKGKGRGKDKQLIQQELDDAHTLHDRETKPMSLPDTILLGLTLAEALLVLQALQALSDAMVFPETVEKLGIWELWDKIVPKVREAAKQHNLEVL